jgi:hypothetical protein
LGGFGVARSGDKVRLLREADPVPKVTLRNGSSAKSKHPGARPSGRARRLWRTPIRPESLRRRFTRLADDFFVAHRGRLVAAGDRSVWSLSVEASYAFRVLEVPSVSCREMGRLECAREPSAV